MEGTWGINFYGTNTVTEITFRKGGIFHQKMGNYYGTWRLIENDLEMNYIGNMTVCVMLRSTVSLQSFSGYNDKFSWTAWKHGPTIDVPPISLIPPIPSNHSSRQPKKTRSGKVY